MSTEYNTLTATDDRMEEVRTLSFYGGYANGSKTEGGTNRGRCFQLSQGNWKNTESVKMTKEQVVQAMAEMARWLSEA